MTDCAEVWRLFAEWRAANPWYETMLEALRLHEEALRALPRPQYITYASDSSKMRVRVVPDDRYGYRVEFEDEARA